MNFINQMIATLDAFQRRHLATAFAVGLQKKYGEDQAGNLGVQLTYSMFVTVFPLLLLLVTILGIVLADHPAERARVLHSVASEFPVIGDQLTHNVQALKRGSPFGLAIGIIGVVYGTTGLAQAGLYAMEQIWAIPTKDRPNFFIRLGRSLAFLAFLGIGLIVTTALSGFGTFGRHNVALGYLAEAVAAMVNVGIYLGSFCVLTPKFIRPRQLIPGAIVGGIAWTVLQAFGGYIVGHTLKGASATYGTFGLVLGLVAWIALGAKITVYCAEVNTVIDRHAWPVPLAGNSSDSTTG
ncbi:MAG TPA: YihY/virulence factor BrkB family protein [Acidimicrobiales bacterium]|nr:YihY/virulence factor BrkB family protein [Acidimicrobiales bacterium]